MAEFCLECFNKLNGSHYTEDQVWLEQDFCEGCGEWKACVRQINSKKKRKLGVQWAERAKELFREKGK